MRDLDQRTDIELLRAWKGEDQAAGRVLYRRHFDAVDRFFRNKVSEPEDLTQRTFVVCLQAPERFEGRSRFSTYLLGIAYRLLLEHYRDRARVHALKDSDEHSVAALEPTPSEVLADRAAHRQLLEALRRLPLRHQVIIELRFWEDLKVREIAEILEMPEGTVKDRLRRSRRQLERSMAELGASGGELPPTATRLEDWAQQIRRGLDRSEHSGTHGLDEG